MLTTLILPDGIVPYGHRISTCYLTKACSINLRICAGCWLVKGLHFKYRILVLVEFEGGVKHREQELDQRIIRCLPPVRIWKLDECCNLQDLK